MTMKKRDFLQKETLKLQWKLRIFKIFLQATQPTKRRSESAPGEDLRVRINTYICFIFVRFILGRKSEIAHFIPQCTWFYTKVSGVNVL